MNTTLTNSLRTSLERWWNNYQGCRRWTLPMGFCQGRVCPPGPVPPPQAGADSWGWPWSGQAVGLRPGRAVGSWRWAVLWLHHHWDRDWWLWRAGQWCSLTINTPRPIFRDPQSFAHIPWTETISFSHFQPIPIQTKKLPLIKWQDILACFTLIFYAPPFYQTHEAVWAADPREMCGFCFTNVAGKACSKHKKARRALGWKDTV